MYLNKYLQNYCGKHQTICAESAVFRHHLIISLEALEACVMHITLATMPADTMVMAESINLSLPCRLYL